VSATQQRTRRQGPRAFPASNTSFAVASGKGGVGKSTTSCNLALGFGALGLKAGILDADIYGPSQPKLFGLRGKPRQAGNGMLEPMERFGVKVMSIGFLVEEDLAMIWRGPMVISAITQMLHQVAWADLDILRGRPAARHRRRAAHHGAAGAARRRVIVSTPQDLALIDARRGIAMFHKVNIRFSDDREHVGFLLPGLPSRHPGLRSWRARQEAETRGIPISAASRLDIQIRETSDEGRPIVAVEPDSVHARHYTGIAREVWLAVASGAASRPAPRIVIE